MRCVLVFDHINDVIFSKYDVNFAQHTAKLGLEQGIDPSLFSVTNSTREGLSENVIIQLFSPIVTSQRIMSSQFGNSYTSIQCRDGLNMVFNEFMGFLFVQIGLEDVNWLKRMLSTSLAIIQHFCGPDISTLKSNLPRKALVSRLIDTWTRLVSDDQSALLEAIEPLSVNTEVSSVAVKALRDASDKIKSQLDRPKCHAALFVENKFLALYSSKTARDLSPGDLLFLSLLAEWARNESRGLKARSSETDLVQDLILLSSNDLPAASPYALNIFSIDQSVSLVMLYQTQFDSLNIALNEAFESLHIINSAPICSGSSEFQTIKRAMERLEPAVKRIFDAVKKIKAVDMTPRIDACVKVLQVKWDTLKRQWHECSNSDGINSASVGSCCQSLMASLIDLLHFTVLDSSNIRGEGISSTIRKISNGVLSHLTNFSSFLQVKALRNFTLGSKASLSINKYLEEFPGLVHFMYIDRINHRLTAPSIDFQVEHTVTLTKEMVWNMVEFGRSHLQEGHLAIMWKDASFNYAYYLWFEDLSGLPLKPKVSASTAVKTLSLSGVISGDFYKKLIEGCFPKIQPEKIRCFELYCVHLGLATSSCVLEQSRRLAATIWEVTGMPNNPLDLL